MHRIIESRSVGACQRRGAIEWQDYTGIYRLPFKVFGHVVLYGRKTKPLAKKYGFNSSGFQFWKLAFIKGF